MIYLSPFFSYLAGSKGVSTLSAPDTMTITTVEAIASSSGKSDQENVYNCAIGQWINQNKNYKKIMQ